MMKQGIVQDLASKEESEKEESDDES